MELSIAEGDGRYLKLVNGLARVDVLMPDYWGLDVLTPERRRILLELLDGGYDKRNTLFTSQFPTDA